MKKKFTTNTIYFAVPLILLVLFTPIYLSAKHNMEDKLEVMHQAELRDKEQRIANENILKAKAIEEANASAARHNAERKAKEERDTQQKEERQRMIEVRNRVGEELILDLNKESELDRDVVVAKDEVRKIEDQEAKLRQDKGFLIGYVKETEAGRAALTAVLEKIKYADQQAELARAALANAAKNKS
jgi:hypothetical protein